MPRRKLSGFSSALVGWFTTETHVKAAVLLPTAWRNRRRVDLDIGYLQNERWAQTLPFGSRLFDQQLAEEIACHGMNPRILTFAGAGDVENADLFSFKPRAYPFDVRCSIQSDDLTWLVKMSRQPHRTGRSSL